jgi:hypothetical protein
VPCDRQKNCGFYSRHKECTGCTYQHVWKVLRKNVQDREARKLLQAIDHYLWERGSNPHRGKGGRQWVDVVLRKELPKLIPGLTLQCSNHTEIIIQNQKITIKHDGHFKKTRKNGEIEVVIEYKGCPEEGHILATLKAAEMLKGNIENKNLKFFFLCHKSLR